MASGRIVLAGVSPEIAGLQWETNDILRIGRQQNSEIILNHFTISRHHAEVLASPQGWLVRDLGSANGTMVNGIPVSQGPRKLQAEDVIQFGSLSVKVSELETAAPPAVPFRQTPLQIKTSGPMLRVQALSQRSWEQGVGDPSDNEQRLPQGKHFLTLLRAGFHLSRITSLPDFLQAVLDDTVAVVDAHCGAIVLADKGTGQLTLQAVSETKGRGSSKKFSQTLAERCFNKGESLLCQNTNQEPLAASIPGDMGSVICAILRSPRARLGILHLHREPFHEPFSQNDLNLTDTIAANTSMGIESAQLFEKQKQHYTQESACLALLLLEVLSPAVRSHCRRVAAVAVTLAQELKLSLQEQHQLRIAALICETGKSDDELASLPGLDAFVPVIRHRHERWDGQGTPDGLAAENIPRLSRVLAVADALDKLVTPCLSGPGLPLAKAIAEIQQKSTRDFDPECAAVLAKLQGVIATVLSES